MKNTKKKLNSHSRVIKETITGSSITKYSGLISCVYNLIFNGRMESSSWRIGEANTHPPSGGFGWSENVLLGISFAQKIMFINWFLN